MPASVPEYLRDSPVCPKEGQTAPPYSLPSAWNVKDKCSYMELANNNLQARYEGSGKTDGDAAAVRANFSIPPQTGIYYYEVDIINKGRDGYIAIGFCTQSVSLNRLPGWEPNSYGYHGDDGHSFSCQGQGKSYGPTFTTGDTIGCGINFVNMTAFYTKNGVYLGTAFRDIKGTLFPSLGLRTPGEIVEANFGAKPFKYDIAHHVHEERERLLKHIQAIDLPFSPSASSSSIPSDAPPTSKDKDKEGSSRSLNTTSPPSRIVNGLNEIVLSYLVHHGYQETALEFFRDAFGAKITVAEGKNNADAAMDVDDGRSKEDAGSSASGIGLQEIMSISERKKIVNALLHGDVDTTMTLLNALNPSILPSNGKLEFHLYIRKFVELVKSYNNATTSQMDIDTSQSQAMMSSTTAADGVDTNATLDNIMTLGMQLQSKYGEVAEFAGTLKDAFSLMAYPNLEESPVKYLLDDGTLETLATELNSAILVSQSASPDPPLQRIYRQSVVANDELVRQGDGRGAIINLIRDLGRA